MNCSHHGVCLHGLLRQINHVRGKERLAVLFEVSLVGIEHAVEPRKQLLCAVIGVQDNGNAVGRSDGADVVGRSDSTCEAGRLLVKMSVACKTILENWVNSLPAIEASWFLLPTPLPSVQC